MQSGGFNSGSSTFCLLPWLFWSSVKRVIVVKTNGIDHFTIQNKRLNTMVIFASQTKEKRNNEHKAGLRVESHLIILHRSAFTVRHPCRHGSVFFLGNAELALHSWIALDTRTLSWDSFEKRCNAVKNKNSLILFDAVSVVSRCWACSPTRIVFRSNSGTFVPGSYSTRSGADCWRQELMQTFREADSNHEQSSQKKPAPSSNCWLRIERPTSGMSILSV